MKSIEGISMLRFRVFTLPGLLWLRTRGEV